MQLELPYIYRAYRLFPPRGGRPMDGRTDGRHRGHGAAGIPREQSSAGAAACVKARRSALPRDFSSRAGERDRQTDR